MSAEIEQLRARLEFRQEVQKEIQQLRTWMLSRGEAHDLAFLEATDPYVAWLEREIAEVGRRLAELDTTTGGEAS